MNYTQKLINEDQNIVSWQITKTESLPITVIDKPNILNSDITYKRIISVDGISHAKTRYTDTFYFYENDVIIGHSIKTYGEYTHVEVELLEQYLDDSTIVYDIGGNIGYHTLAFAQKAKHVYSFEPNLKNLKVLEKNVGHLKNVSVIKAACSDVAGTSHISDYDITQHGNYGECLMGDTGQPCTTIRLDDLNLPKPNLLKIDVEGHELKVFLGAKETIRSTEPVIFYEAMHGSGFDQIYDFLNTELGYKLYWIGVKNYNPKNYNKVSHNIFGNGGVVNILALPSRYKVDEYLEPVIDRDDTHVKFITRIMQRFNRG